MAWDGRLGESFATDLPGGAGGEAEDFGDLLSVLREGGALSSAISRGGHGGHGGHGRG